MIRSPKSFCSAPPPNPTGTDDERKSARVIAATVIPAYYAARKPAAGFTRATGKSIEITLVRWPYT